MCASIVRSNIQVFCKPAPERRSTSGLRDHSSIWKHTRSITGTVRKYIQGVRRSAKPDPFGSMIYGGEVELNRTHKPLLVPGEKSHLLRKPLPMEESSIYQSAQVAPVFCFSCSIKQSTEYNPLSCDKRGLRTLRKNCTLLYCIIGLTEKPHIETPELTE